MKELNMSDEDYRSDFGLANSDLLLMQRSPSDYQWSKNAPRNKAKSKTTDIGTALHCLLLEPERYDDLILVSGMKGRTTKGFIDEQSNNPDNIVLTQEEAEQVKLMVASVKAHPTARMLIEAKGDCESSVFVNDAETGLRLKCRPDKDLFESMGLILDVKTTASIDDWRSDKEWINPLFKFNYGHQASHYINVLEQHYNTEINQFIFLVIQSSIELGSYPVAVFTLSKEQIIEQGFYTQQRENLNKAKECFISDDWVSFEEFNFYHADGYEDDVEVTFEDDV